MKYYNKFVSTMVCDYDNTNAAHEANLKRLYTKMFEEEPEEGGNFVSDKWKDIGF